MRPHDRPATRRALAGTLTRLVAALGIAAALGLGTRTALADPVFLECPYNPAVGELGACVSDGWCDDTCFAMFGSVPGGCTNVGGQSCCLCPY